MKIFSSTGSKERLFEMMGRVNKFNINENINEIGGQSLNPASVLSVAFSQLVGKKINIQQSKTYASDDESFVELMGTDGEGNNITFTFKITSSEADQDGVYNINDASLTSFTFDSVSGDTVELDENGLNQFNMQHKNEIIGIVSDYADFDENVPEIDESYLDAIKKIDSYPFGGTPRTMQTSQAYGDEKPTNSKVRVKAPELNKFVDEEVTIGTTGIMGGTPKPANPSTKSPIESLPENKKKIIKTAIDNITVKKGRREYAPTAAEIQAEINRMKTESKTVKEADERTMFTNDDDVFITTGQYDAKKTFDSMSKEAQKQYIDKAQIAIENMLKSSGMSFDEYINKDIDAYRKSLYNLALMFFERVQSASRVNEEDNYPDPIGKKFKTKSKYPKAKKKPQTTVNIDENDDEENIEDLSRMHDEEGEKLKGGLGDDESPANFDPEQVSLGVKVEMEHTDDPMEALEIALDHLTEDPEYYTVKDDPEASAQFNAANDAEEKEEEMPHESGAYLQDGMPGEFDRNGHPIPAIDPFYKLPDEDELLGFKPKNVGDYEGSAELEK